MEAYFSASFPTGLFAPPETSPHAQRALLAALDLHLTPQQRQQGERAAGDDSISLEAFTQTLPSWIPSTSPMGCCVVGGLEFGAGMVRGHHHASGVRLITVFSFRRAASTPGALPVWNSVPSGRRL